MNYLLPSRLDALARDYALGTMTGGARRRFERLLREHGAAAFAAAAWAGRLGHLAQAVPPMTPSAAVWAGLERRLFGRPGAEPSARALPPSRPVSAARRLWTWFNAGLARGPVAGVVGGLAGVLLCVVVLRQQPGWIGMEPYQDGLAPSYVGLLLDGAGRPSLLASSRRHGRQLTVKLLQPIDVPAGQVAQLWALPNGGAAPFAVGTIPAKGSATLLLSDPAEKLFFTVTRLAVSLEPASAAAAPQAPSTPFLLTGHCVKLW